jgi:hypothetical protein
MIRLLLLCGEMSRFGFSIFIQSILSKNIFQQVVSDFLAQNGIVLSLNADDPSIEFTFVSYKDGT